MRKVKTYGLKNPIPSANIKGKRTLAVLEMLKNGPKTAKEIHTALGRYTPGGVGAALSELRAAGLLDE